MNLTTAKVKIEHQERIRKHNDYVNAPNKEETVVTGSFYQAKPMTIREMVTRKINKSLCGCLIFTILVTFVSYYIAMNYEAKLNSLDNEIVRLNEENQNLQAELDKYKSFNNVDTKIGEFNLLQKADKVIEVTALTSVKNSDNTSKTASSNFNWAIGY
ncbi:hypothetical protein HDR58_04800 [bacterium]|nr:hypothetical protein [bacterium]